MTTSLLTARARQWPGRSWLPSAQVVALGIWMVAAGLAAGAVGLVFALRRIGAAVPEVYLSNIWSALVLPGVAMLLVSRRRYRLMGWLLAAGGIGLAATSFCDAFAGWAVARCGCASGWAGAAVWVGAWTWMLSMLPVVALLLLPEGAVGGWRRHLVILGWAACGVRIAFSALSGPGTVDPVTGAVSAAPKPAAIPYLEAFVWPMLLSTAVVLIAAQVTTCCYLVWRWRRSIGGDRVSVGVLALAGVVMMLPSVVPVAEDFWDAATLPLFAVLVAVGLLGFGSGDHDLVASRAYLWASLTMCVVATYVAVVALLAAVVQRAAGASVALAATGLVALLAAPLRSHLQRGVDRLFYGARADPYASVAALGRQLHASVSPDEVLPAVVRTITEELRLPYAAFHLTGEEEPILTVEHGCARGDLVEMPVAYLGQRVGHLVVSTPGSGVPLRAAERRLLADLARQVGPAAHGVATLAQLRRSRTRLVAAREAERQSLRRELHDDLGALLTSVALGVDAAGNRLPADSPVVRQLSRTRAVVSTAVTELRRIIEGLRPPALDEVGLVAAIQDRLLMLSDGGPRIDVRAGELPFLPPEIEVACYHVVVEAVHNAVRHAHARHVTVELVADRGHVTLVVRDDGRGFRDCAGPGQGLVTMRQRVEECGGSLTVNSGPAGTTLSATLPGAGDE